MQAKSRQNCEKWSSLQAVDSLFLILLLVFCFIIARPPARTTTLISPGPPQRFSPIREAPAAPSPPLLLHAVLLWFFLLSSLLPSVFDCSCLASLSASPTMRIF